jgi:catechol 2,3-dioxygenase-like lactoylglutathione lyase family enzyme
MNSYPSSITFLYYEDLTYGRYFLQDVLGLSLVMDQGFAAIYQVTPSSFIGAVQRRDATRVSGDTLISLNTTDVQAAYDALPHDALVDVTPIERIPSIPLDSFFFFDREGHRFEIQQFVNQSDLDLFCKEER